MNKVIYWTSAAQPKNKSSLISLLIHNVNTSELYVVLTGDALSSYGEAYKYSGVSEETFRDFVAAESAGGYYNSKIKGAYGPSVALGDYERLDWNWVSRRTATEAPVSTIGTPKGLVYADNAVVTNISEPVEQQYFRLGHNEASTASTTTNTVVLDTNTSRKHVVHFGVVGAEINDRTFPTTAGSVESAVAQLNAHAFALGVNVKVTKVEVFFE